MALTVMPILGFTGVAGADHIETAQPTGDGNVCEDAPETDPFTDVADDDIAVDEIRCMVNTDPQITFGTTATTYSPTAPVTRRQMALFLWRVGQLAEAHETSEDAVTALPEGDGTVPFSDIETDDPAFPEIDSLNEAVVDGQPIADGFPDGTFRPNEPVTRRQMANFLVRLQRYLAGADFPPPVGENNFDDLEESDTGYEALNILAEEGVFTGVASTTGEHNVQPGEDISRRQMAFVITRKLEVFFEAGVIDRLFAEDDTNQSFTVDPAGDVAVQTGDDADFAVTGITSDTVDIKLFDCADVTVDEDGTVTFADANNDGIADWNTADTAAVITEVNDVAGTYGDSVDDAVVTDGGITFTVNTAADECVVAVVWDDADDDNNLDVDADGLPTEDFAIGAFLTSGTVAALNATPETAVNQYGTDHTVTATLEDAADDTVALDGAVIRFQVVRGSTTCDTAGDTLPDGTVVATGSDTTEDGVATFTYSVADPTPGTVGGDTNDCIVSYWDQNNNSVNDDTHQDVVSKTWSEAPATATALSLTPETDTNLVGTQHTVTATVTDQFGDPVDSNVTFEVYRDGAPTTTFTTTQATGADGVASFTYTGPAADADDVIVACVEDAGDLDTDCLAVDGVTIDDPGDSAEKFWVEQADATTGDVAAADVIGFDTAADTVDVENAGGDNLRLAYDADDQYTVGGTPATMAQFEAALSLGDTLTVDYNPGGVSVFNLTNTP